MHRIFERFLDQWGIKVLQLDGSTPTDLRRQLVDQFNSSPEITVFLPSMAGSSGINLTSADTVIFSDHDWNPANERHQALADGRRRTGRPDPGDFEVAAAAGEAPACGLSCWRPRSAAIARAAIALIAAMKAALVVEPAGSWKRTGGMGDSPGGAWAAGRAFPPFLILIHHCRAGNDLVSGFMPGCVS
ncbi:MAG: DEAD/DEAH box helicase [Planctomycetaceae bacterium]|nr:DEAD/DEAH box helicase [Planctomycetaceae bacterium]